MATLTIRRAVPADADALAEFGARTFFEAFAAGNTAEDMRRHLASAWSPVMQASEIADSSIDTLLVVAADGALAGFAQLQAHAPANLSATAPIELKRFYVDAPWQGLGLAQRLMAAVETRAREREGAELWLGVWQQNPRARRFYEKCGFQKVGTQIFVVGSDPQTDDVMLKTL